MIKITLNDTQAKQQLKEIAVSLRKPEKMYGVIGETLKKIHTQRFKDEKSPDGKKWQELSSITKKIKEEKGKSKKILRQDGYLSDLLAYNYNHQGVEFGSTLKYARLHQYGATIRPKHSSVLAFGSNKNPHFAKQVIIPARPWLGLNQNNEDLLVSKARSVLSRQIAQILR
ncbi:phage virion morphogenesis protein [Pasteurella skyensis]|uniref:Phage virion morphogenesis protein n=1 Tax=Phocoenobacter skyensis TaxID=97481 RepID=A0AAJ6N9D4_9PAST|nr:phage virion morphogenesis protein [Pasteurella skyensis]MDP8162812.1 phage virion morphogenesis protein [Pasteurella skyensis]MDP8172601.1 phage virion morphogenesis protein [Pasteurella skyensis]MDP8179101.1 phage virion morphogenesis protein [Pasteurella skyensis]MDP8183214.1 phage virion morphogenesis protein [Pasteurella skyensis]MDP8189265.1 phage virion morphogenesis protein [Pasteurella skyensis]